MVDLNDEILWNFIENIDKENYINKIKYILLEFGTKECCNRFDVGNSIEYIICEMMNSVGLNVEECPNAKRIDLILNKKYKLSVKYSSVGDITLHNSNSCANTDLNMTDLLLLTPTELYLITNLELAKHGIDIKVFLKNKEDSLKLNRKILKILKTKNYPYIINFDITVDKNLCKNRLCSKIFYNSIMAEYNSIIK